MRARISLANEVLAWGDAPHLKVPKGAGHVAWSPAQHVRAAQKALGEPWLSNGSKKVLLQLAQGFGAGQPLNRDSADMLQMVLRNLMISGPDAQLH